MLYKRENTIEQQNMSSKLNLLKIAYEKLY